MEQFRGENMNDTNMLGLTLSYKSMARTLNDRVLGDYFYRLMLISRALFKWDNLPNGIDENWIERYLFSEGKCLFYKDPTIGFMVAKMGECGNLNYYDEPTKVRPYATNYLYEGEQLENNVNCVIIKNNDIMIPTSPTIQLYAYKLTNIDRTIDVNIIAQKTPIIVKCSDKQRLSLKNAINQRNDNEPVIYADKNLDMSSIEVLDLFPFEYGVLKSLKIYTLISVKLNFNSSQSMKFLKIGREPNVGLSTLEKGVVGCVFRNSCNAS